MLEPFSREQLTDWAEDARARWSVPGMAVGVLRNGEILAAASGVRQLGADVPVSPDDVFRIASVTKPFVATLVMSLVVDGHLDLDGPPPSIRQLLSHHAALECERPEPIDGVGPGELFSYSNAGFWLVGAAVAQAAETSFEAAMQARVLEPLGLASTGFEAADGVPGHYQAPGSDRHRVAETEYPVERRPSGGLWSSVGDLLRFAVHHLAADEPLAELQRPASFPPGCRHGLGWFLTERGGRRAAEHAGSVAGYQSLLLLVPDERLAFAALTNSSRGSAAIRDVLDRLGLSPPVREDIRLSPSELEAFTGRYKSPGIRTVVEPMGPNLRLTSSERDPLTREIFEYPRMVGRPVGEREFEVVDGERRGEVFGFPRAGFLSFGVLSRRVS